MSHTWKRSFEISVPIDDVWEAFTNEAYRAKLFAPPQGEPVRPRNVTMEILEAEPKRLLRWSQEHKDYGEKAEFTVVFESHEGGSRIQVTRAGFGEGEDVDIFSKSNSLGWEHGFMDLVLFLETGHLVKRHYDGCRGSSTGIAYEETDSGLRVCGVEPGTFGAQAGLERGDRIVRLGGASIYKRSDLWVLLDVLKADAEVEVEYIRGRELCTSRGRLSTLDERAVGE